MVLFIVTITSSLSFGQISQVIRSIPLRRSCVQWQNVSSEKDRWRENERAALAFSHSGESDACVFLKPVLLAPVLACGQPCLTLCHPMDCVQSTSTSVQGIFQARIPEWVAISYSRGTYVKSCKIRPLVIPSSSNWFLQSQKS